MDALIQNITEAKRIIVDIGALLDIMGAKGRFSHRGFHNREEECECVLPKACESVYRMAEKALQLLSEIVPGETTN